jgi:hypothetical protein
MVLEGPVSGAAKTNSAVSTIAGRLLDSQSHLVEINSKIATLVLWSEVDPEQKPKLDAARSRQQEAKQRVEDLQRAEALARELASEAERRSPMSRRCTAGWNGR